ncbi:hypothetical protein BC937DRAFT_93768 [Endogone sp. FLAS-F59071]|nr:hypothetical protein BC937DRAFT_93768 [Endogone sp. FLAS-F59071]|eukprot:RUS14473.1 hypothetical protein BC937DRAFT_93768 [Endogone sp. FLAS-F59071]
MVGIRTNVLDKCRPNWCHGDTFPTMFVAFMHMILAPSFSNQFIKLNDGLFIDTSHKADYYPNDNLELFPNDRDDFPPEFGSLQPVPPPFSGEFQLRLLCPAVQGATQYTCGAVLESRFLLLGHNDGLHVLDLAATSVATATAAAMPKRLAVNSRFRKLQVLEGCRVLLALAGRNRHVRCYSLDTILYVVYVVFGLNWETRKGKAYNVPSIKDLKSAEAATGDPPKQNSGSNATLSNVASGPFAKAATAVEAGGTNSAAQTNGAGGLNLDTHYFKIPDTRETIEFDVYTTSAYIYIAVLTKDKITVWQRTKDPGMRGFTRVKVFWIPIEPVHMCLADDRTSLKHIVAVFSGDATVINLRDSKVKTIALDPAIIALHRESWAQQIQNTTQGSSPGATTISGSHNPSPHSSPLSTSHASPSGQPAPIPVPSISSSSSPGYTHYFNNSAFSSLTSSSSLPILSGTSQNLRSPPLNANPPFSTPSSPPSTTASSNPFQIRPLQLPSRKETGPPPITWTSLIQLPFPPDLLPPESLTQGFTVPPAYATVVNAPADAHLHAPIPLTSSSPQLFLATLATRSYIIDVTGALYSTSTLQWGMVPLHVEFVRISAHNVSSVYVVGFGKTAVEVLDLRTGRCVQRAVRGVPVEYLGRWDEPGKEFKALFWCCFVKGVAYLYILKRTAEGGLAMSTAG